MITIFSNPRPFKGSFLISQKNAIRNWKVAIPNAQILLIDDEEHTTAAVAKELGVTCIQSVQQNQYGTPLLDSVFSEVRKYATHDLLAQINIDILLLPDFLETLQHMPVDRFYLVGQRWDVAINKELDFSTPEWPEQLKNLIHSTGNYHPAAGSDYWIFPKKVQFNVPPFIVGRPGADNWLIYNFKSRGVPIIDASNSITIIHQDHPRKDGDQIYEKEKKQNEEIYRKSTNPNKQGAYYFDLSDSDYIFDHNKLKKKQLSFITSLKKNFLYARYVPRLLKSSSFFWSVVDKFTNPLFELLLKKSP